MSLFGGFFNDMEDDPFFGSHMRTMRQMNNMMNSLFADPFGGMMDFGDRALTGPNHHHHHHHSHHRSGNNMALAPFGNFGMPNINRLIGGSLNDLNNGNSHCYSSSTVVSMVSGPDGRPQVYKSSSSTRIVPGGIKETQKTVCDSVSGKKMMSIGHHIGERAHIVEREENLHSGDQEERQEFINLEEDEADSFNKEWQTKARNQSDLPRIGAGGSGGRHRHHHHGHGSGGQLAITAGPSSRRHRERQTGSSLVSPRRSIRSSPLTVPHTSVSSSSRRPYSPPGQPTPRKSKNIKTVSGSPPPDI